MFQSSEMLQGSVRPVISKLPDSCEIDCIEVLILSSSTVMAFALRDSLSPSLLRAYFGPWPADGRRRTEVAF
jgi:hypothetical protein